MIRLIIQGKNQSVRQFNIDGPIATIGRAPTNRVCIDSDRVSRHHAVIQWSGDCYMLSDMGSRNGSFVNDERVHNQALRDGDSVSIGDFSIRFLYSSSMRELPAAEALRLLTLPAELHHRPLGRPAMGVARKSAWTAVWR
ncbi:conserved hypothetical protein [Burkholderiales bacterium 8X]|nr:conserved hypothetical protein [Burkholderiales bacterium 8X]